MGKYHVAWLGKKAARGRKVEFIMGWIEWQSQPSREETWCYKYTCSCCTMLHICVNLSIHLLWTLIIYPPLQFVVLFHSAPSAKPRARKGVFTGDHHPTDWAWNVWVMSIVASGPALNTAMTSFDSQYNMLYKSVWKPQERHQQAMVNSINNLLLDIQHT